MESSEILNALQKDDTTFSREAAREAMRRREEITPQLIELLRDTTARAEEIAGNDTDGLFFLRLYALFLLAQFREVRAYPVIVELFRLKEEVLDELFVDFVGEELPVVLASVCDGDTGLIETLIEDPSVSPGVRGAGIRAFLVLVAAGDKTRDEAMGYYQALFEGRLERRKSEVWDELVQCSIFLYPEEVRGHIEEVQKQGLLHAFSAPFKRVGLALAQDRETVLGRLPKGAPVYVESAIAEVESWTCFDTPPLPDDIESTRIDVDSAFLKAMFPDHWERPWELDGYSKTFTETPDDSMDDDPMDHAPMPPAPVRTTKVGPNDPCPCGSGKKFKKCCGKLA